MGGAVTDSSPQGPEPRQRDAVRTRQQLLQAARRRFAVDGYDAATVRDIADEVGVNVALINRYFGSKAGLFEACLSDVVQEMAGSTRAVHGLSQVVEAISHAAVRASAEGGWSEVLLLLLRPSRDEGAEQKRVGLLRELASELALAAGWVPGSPAEEGLLLRAELVLAAAAGIVMLRSARGLEPLGSATEQQLLGPLHDLVTALLSRSG
jgi:AcrR family transcriptional regulator